MPRNCVSECKFSVICSCFEMKTSFFALAGSLCDGAGNISAAETVQAELLDIEVLPTVTTADNGKFLRVVNGAWAVAEVDNASGVSF